jgi:alpha-D-xyloside xylohydrolase
MKAIFSIFVLALILNISTKAQSYQKTNLGIKTVINSVGIEIQFYNPSAVRILKWREGTIFAKKSLSVNKIPQETVFSIKQQGDDLLLLNYKLQDYYPANIYNLSF